MRYSISQAAEEKGLETHTLRFYEREGIILPQRTDSGIRYYTDQDLDRIDMINCLKCTGMSIKEIKRYFDLCEEGDGSLEERLSMFLERKQHVLKEIEEMRHHLETVDHKIGWYRSMIKDRDSAKAEAEKE